MDLRQGCERVLGAVNPSSFPPGNQIGNPVAKSTLHVKALKPQDFSRPGWGLPKDVPPKDTLLESDQASIKRLGGGVAGTAGPQRADDSGKP